MKAGTRFLPNTISSSNDNASMSRSIDLRCIETGGHAPAAGEWDLPPSAAAAASGNSRRLGSESFPASSFVGNAAKARKRRADEIPGSHRECGAGDGVSTPPHRRVPRTFRGRTVEAEIAASGAVLLSTPWLEESYPEVLRAVVSAEEDDEESLDREAAELFRGLALRPSLSEDEIEEASSRNGATMALQRCRLDEDCMGGSDWQRNEGTGAIEDFREIGHSFAFDEEEELQGFSFVNFNGDRPRFPQGTRMLK